MTTKTFAAAVALSAVAATGGSAATLTATSNSASNSVGTSGWVAEFDDLNSDGLYSTNETTSFTPFTINGDAILRMVGSPDIAGVAAENGLDVFLVAGQNIWVFERVDGTFGGVAPNAWEYEVTGLAAVPLPAGGLLLLSGLGGVAALKRRKKRAA